MIPPIHDDLEPIITGAYMTCSAAFQVLHKKKKEEKRGRRERAVVDVRAGQTNHIKEEEQDEEEVGNTVGVGDRY